MTALTQALPVREPAGEPGWHGPPPGKRRSSASSSRGPPDGRYLMAAGYDLYVIRPDGTGRATVQVEGFPGGGIFPDWTA